MRALLLALLLFTFGTPGALAQTAVKFEIVLEHRKIAGENVIRVMQGDQVRLIWTSDEKLELHLHGYNIEATAAPGKPGEMAFVARATGRFPVEIHGHGGGHHGGALLYLEVHPK